MVKFQNYKSDTYNNDVLLGYVKHNQELTKQFLLGHSAVRIGNGSFGTCYQVNKDKAVKITTSYQEYENSKKLIGKNLKNVVNIFKAEKYSDPYQNTIYLIMMELLDQPDRKFIWENIGGDTINVTLSNPTILYKNNIFEQVKAAYFQLKQIGIEHNDIHYGNVLRSKIDRKLYKVIDIMTF